MHKLSRSAQTLDFVIRIIFWFFLFTQLLSLLLSIYSIIIQTLHYDNVSIISQGLNLGNISLTLDADVLPNQQAMNRYRYLILALNVIHLPIYCLMLQSVRRILKPFINQTPFHQTVAANLKKLSILVLVVGILNTAIDYVSYHYTVTNFDLKALLVNEQILSVSTQFSINWTPLFFAVTLYLLSYIFQYGQELQQLSDETV